MDNFSKRQGEVLEFMYAHMKGIPKMEWLCQNGGHVL
jgi:hypothetical protein